MNRPLRWCGLLVVAGLAACTSPAPGAPVAVPTAATPATPTAPVVELPGPVPLPAAQVAVTGLVIPAIGLDTAEVETLGLLPDGTLAAPVDYGRVGWFAAGTVPGATGPAVIAGHVDSVRPSSCPTVGRWSSA